MDLSLKPALALALLALPLSSLALAQRPIPLGPLNPGGAPNLNPYYTTAPAPNFDVEELDDGTIVATDPSGTFLYRDWPSYFASPFFRANNMRCGAGYAPNTGQAGFTGSPADCTTSSTTIKSEYNASNGTRTINVVFHVLHRTNGVGNLSDALLMSQIDILNEDFLAIAGTNGSGGSDSAIQFQLASVDPNGNPTSGITRTASNSWYNDHGNYKSALAWDTNRYLNIYTNTAGGYLGYAYIPQGGGVVGNTIDGVVLNWQATGRNAPGGPPYDQGRTATHEVGHYLGLYHTFDGGCGSASCYTTGDLICDTASESGPRYGCPSNPVSCGTLDPYENYMDYTDDLCMTEFTVQQVNRMRCTVDNWRPDLDDSGTPPPPPPGNDPVSIFFDGFEDGNANGWATTGSVAVTSGAKRTGSYGVRCSNASSMSRTISTVGFDSIEVKYSRRTRSLDNGEELTVELNTAVAETTSSKSWGDITVNVTSATDSSVTIEFILDANQNRERADIDNIEVLGVPLP